LEFQAARHHVRADPARMRQVYWNLLRNAVKFTPEGGSITLRTRNVGDRLEIEIIDTGIGIDPEVIPRIFNRFEQGETSKTRQFGGLGLGLNIAQGIVELHQGRLTAFSEGKNKGAAFTVDLATVPPQEKPVPSPTSGEPEARPLRILLVEDHPDTMRVFVKLLKKWGHSVTTAESVKKALELVSGQDYDLLISDLGLPDGSGLDVMRQAKECSRISGIALSGYGAEEDIRQSRAAGFSGHLVKPVSIAALRTAIRQIAASRL
jgi:CheY-like chemotaxis protein